MQGKIEQLLLKVGINIMNLSNKSVFFFLKVAIGIGIIFILFKQIGFANIHQTLLGMDFKIFPFAILIYLVALLMGSLNLKILLHPLNSSISYILVTKYYLLSSAFGSLTPGQIGEISLVYLLKKKNIEYEYGLIIVMVNKLITVMVLSFISLIGFAIFFDAHLVLLYFTCFISLAVAVFIFFNENINLIFAKILSHHNISKFRAFKVMFLAYVLNEKKAIAINFGITFLRMVIISYFLIVVYASFNQSVRLSSVLMITSISMLTSIIPVSINGLGIQETVTIYLFGLIGLKSEIVASVSIVALVLTYMIYIITFIMYSIDRKT